MFFIFAVRMSGSSERMFATLVGLCAVLCCIGLLRRRRFGVVFFVVFYLMLLITVPFLDALRNRPSSLQQQGQAFPTLVFLIVTTVYFKKRWRLMEW